MGNYNFYTQLSQLWDINRHACQKDDCNKPHFRRFRCKMRQKNEKYDEIREYSSRKWRSFQRTSLALGSLSAKGGLIQKNLPKYQPSEATSRFSQAQELQVDTYDIYSIRANKKFSGLFTHVSVCLFPFGCFEVKLFSQMAPPLMSNPTYISQVLTFYATFAILGPQRPCTTIKRV